jgi:RHS repeat-associated protein
LDGTDQVFARVDSGGSAGWYMTDHLGMIREVIASNNLQTDVLAFDAFGTLLSETNSAYGDRYKYTGREFDNETRLQYNRSRYLNATISRWMSQDPLGSNAGDTNYYRYVGNNPIYNTDPSGLIQQQAANSHIWVNPKKAHQDVVTPLQQKFNFIWDATFKIPAAAACDTGGVIIQHVTWSPAIQDKNNVKQDLIKGWTWSVAGGTKSLGPYTGSLEFWEVFFIGPKQTETGNDEWAIVNQGDGAHGTIVITGFQTYYPNWTGETDATKAHQAMYKSLEGLGFRPKNETTMDWNLDQLSTSTLPDFQRLGVGLSDSIRSVIRKFNEPVKGTLGIKHIANFSAMNWTTEQNRKLMGDGEDETGRR